MDIKFSNANLTKYWDAVKDCGGEGTERLNLRQEGEGEVVESIPLDDHRVEQVQDPVRGDTNRQLRTMLYQGVRDELQGLKGESSQTVQDYLENVRATLMGPVGSNEGTSGKTADLDSREVKQILSEANEKKNWAFVADLGWSVVDSEDGQELEWQRVTRGRHATVKANDRQVNVLVYGKSAALSRALGVTMAEADALDLRNFTQAEDGTISFDATRQVKGRAVTERLQLGVDGLLTSESRDAAYKPLADVLSGNEWAISCYEMKSPERAFHVANVAEIVKFLNFYGSVKLPERNYIVRIAKTALFNLMQDADKEIERLRESGELKGNAVTNETWWKCLGLKGDFPKGAKGATLATAFQEAVVAKTIDDFLEAKGWDKLADEKTGLTIRQWYYGDFELQAPRNWSGKFLRQALFGFANAIGLSYSQKLKLLKTPVLSRQPLVFDAPTRQSAGKCSAAPSLGVTTRAKGMRITYRPADNPNQWKTHVVVGDENTLEDLTTAGFTPQQISRVGSIANDDPELFMGLDVIPHLMKAHVTVEKKGPDMSLTVRMPAIRVLHGNEDGSQHCVTTLDDLVLKFAVKPDGSYEGTGISFARSARSETEEFDVKYFG